MCVGVVRVVCVKSFRVRQAKWSQRTWSHTGEGDREQMRMKEKPTHSHAVFHVGRVVSSGQRVSTTVTHGSPALLEQCGVLVVVMELLLLPYTRSLHLTPYGKEILHAAHGEPIMVRLVWPLVTVRLALLSLLSPSPFLRSPSAPSTLTSAYPSLNPPTRTNHHTTQHKTCWKPNSSKDFCSRKSLKP